MILLISVLISFNVWAGGAAGNGGDIVFCEQSSINNFKGFYVLDYLATYHPIHNEGTDSSPVRKVWETLLKNKTLEPAATSLFKFLVEIKKQVLKAPDYKAYYIWMPHSFGLIDIRDENLLQLLPPN